MLEYRDKVPPSNPDDLDLMVKVFNKYNVGRMNVILQQFDVDRPSGVKTEDNSSLVAKKFPRDQLLKLLESPEEPKTKKGQKP